MKKFYSLLVVFMLSSTLLMAAADKLQGRVVDEAGKAVGYATVIVFQGGEMVSGVTSDDEGRFSLKVADGDYSLEVEFVGYEPVKRDIKVVGEVDLGDVVMKELATGIEEVVVAATMIRREADRFVVDVANSATAIGKDGTELLKQSPGVRVSSEDISINGAKGTKVYLNDREIKLSGEELVLYVSQLRAEDISKIEIVPQTGADFDASSVGGLIMITTKRRLENGVMGSVKMYTEQSKYIADYNPSASINARLGKVYLSASAWYDSHASNWNAEENTTYNATNATMKATSLQEGTYEYYGTNISVVAELNKNHQLGASFDFWANDGYDTNESNTAFCADAIERLSNSMFGTYNKQNNYTGTLNYIIKTDAQGSKVKFIVDYTHRDTRSGSDNRTSITQLPLPQYDSLYKNDNTGLFRVATATAARERTFSPHWSMKYGAKYTYNEVNSAATYRYKNNGEWTRSVVDDYNVSYGENIGAAYATASMNYGRWSAVMGLRGEFTNAGGKGTDLSQNYFSLFPNANVSYALDEQHKHSLVAQYSRFISRPRFWALMPQRIQVSDYTYQTGNPLLDPAYTDQFSLTGVVAYKYSVTLSAMIVRDKVSQIVDTDALDPRILNLTYANLPAIRQYSMSVSLPITLTKWWDWATNITGSLLEQRITADGPVTNHSMLSWFSTMTFTLPHKFFVDATLMGWTNEYEANMELNGQSSLSVSIKKNIKNSWTLVCDINNIFPSNSIITFRQEDLTRTMQTWGSGNHLSVKVGASWAFKSGKSFRSKRIEKGDNGSRM